MNTILLAGAIASLLHTTLPAIAAASLLGNAVFAIALARTERHANGQAETDARIIARLHADLHDLAYAVDDGEHREAELEAVVARKNEENEALSAIALEHADLSGISVFARGPADQLPGRVNGARP